MDQVVTVSHQSYQSRVRSSCAGMCLAPVFLILGIWLLIWNEGNSVTQHKALEEGLNLVIDVGIDSVDDSNEGKLIHIIGEATTTDKMVDPVFGINPPHALALKRTVETYQWVESQSSETTTNTGGSTTTTTTYSYSKAWKSYIMESAFFYNQTGHENPTNMRFSQNEIEAHPVNVGAFELPSDVMEKILNWYTPIGVGSNVTIPGDSSASDGVAFDNSFYFGSNPRLPEVGDTRVSFGKIPEQIISIVAEQTQSTLSPYVTSNGASVLLVEAGNHDASEMFLHANQSVTTTTWFIRVVGFVIIWLALNTLLAPFATIADVIPCIGNFLAMAQGIIAFLLSVIISTIVINLAWIFNRPLYAIGLLLIMGGTTFAIRKYGRKDNKAPTAEYELPSSQFKDDCIA